MTDLTQEEIERRKALPEAAQTALEEADARRAKREAADAELEKARDTERGGPKNIEPTRFGDWERKGIAYDF